MDDAQILKVLSRILSDLLAGDTIELGMTTTRDDVAGWDSFNYVNFIVAVEMEFGMKFRIADVESFANVGEIVAQIRTGATRRPTA